MRPLAPQGSIGLRQNRRFFFFLIGAGAGTGAGSDATFCEGACLPCLGAVEDEAGIVVHVALKWLDAAVGGEPQPVGDKFDQRAVVGDENDGALVVVERIEQCAAAFDVEVIGRLVENQQVWRRHRHQVQQQPRALAAGKIGDRGFLLVERQSELRQPRPA